MYVYSARLVRIVDADTLVIDLDLGCHVWLHAQRIRAAGINAPELNTTAGRAAKAWADAWFTQHCPDGSLTVRTIKDRSDSFGRILGVVIAPGGACLNDDLLTAGHAVPYPPAPVPAARQPVDQPTGEQPRPA